ncbi:MAG TPA: ABC transporter permease [Terracidiphilus sp.]|nr:ABC transporter permease [Terracidiphilus sp.]
MNSPDYARHYTFEETLLSARRTMVLSEILKLAVDSFRSSKIRFALTALGMVIGTASVILVVTIGLTGKQYILQLLEKLETNSVELEYIGGGAVGSEHTAFNDYLTREDEKAVLAQLPTVLYSSPIISMHAPISFGSGMVKNTLILGVSPQYQQIRNLVMPAGRFLDETDDFAHIKCAVVTEKFAHDRFGGSDSAVGQSFEISGIPFTIVGVFKESVYDFGVSEIEEQTILIPYSVARYFTGTENVNQIYFSMHSMDQVTEAASEIKRIIQARHRPGSVYAVQTLKEVLATAAKVADILTAVLFLVSAVTLIVGGVGIMNIMLANVRARTREIGIRKALGATNREIKYQFLAEAVIISLIGGIAGILVGLALPLSVRIFFDFDLPISVWSVVIALAAATAVGVFFGTMPATRAAQLDPVEALRDE